MVAESENSKNVMEISRDHLGKFPIERLVTDFCFRGPNGGPLEKNIVYSFIVWSSAFLPWLLIICQDLSVLLCSSSYNLTQGVVDALKC